MAVSEATVSEKGKEVKRLPDIMDQMCNAVGGQTVLDNASTHVYQD